MQKELLYHYSHHEVHFPGIGHPENTRPRTRTHQPGCSPHSSCCGQSPPQLPPCQEGRRPVLRRGASRTPQAHLGTPAALMGRGQEPPVRLGFSTCETGRVKAWCWGGRRLSKCHPPTPHSHLLVFPQKCWTSGRPLPVREGPRPPDGEPCKSLAKHRTLEGSERGGGSRSALDSLQGQMGLRWLRRLSS